MREFWVVWDTFKNCPIGPLHSFGRAIEIADAANAFIPDKPFKVRKLTMEEGK